MSRHVAQGIRRERQRGRATPWGKELGLGWVFMLARGMVHTGRWSSKHTHVRVKGGLDVFNIKCVL